MNPAIIAVPIVLVLLGVGATVVGVIFVRKRTKQQQVKQASRERMFSSFEPTRKKGSGSREEPTITPSPLTTITITPVHVPYNDGYKTDWQGTVRGSSSTGPSPSGSPMLTRGSPSLTRGSPSVTRDSPMPQRGSLIPSRMSSTPTPPMYSPEWGPSQQPGMDQETVDMDVGVGMGMVMVMDEEMYEHPPRWQSQMDSIPEGVEPQVTPVPASPRVLTRSPMSRNKPLPQIPTE